MMISRFPSSSIYFESVKDRYANVTTNINHIYSSPYVFQKNIGGTKCVSDFAV